LAQTDVSGGYVYQGATEIDYLTVTETDHKLTGYIQSVTKNSNVEVGYTVAKLNFEGEISGSSFTLHASNYARFFGGGLSECSGKFSAKGAKLYFPKNNGQTSTLQFSRSTPERWNEIVSAFEKACGLDAFRQTWRVALQNHLANLKQLTEKSQSDTVRLARAETSEKDSLAQLQVKMTAADDHLEAMHKARDATRTEADRMAEVAKEAQAECGNDPKAGRGYIGLVPLNLTDDQRKQMHVTGGVFIQEAKTDAPGATAGIKAKDVVVRIGKFPVANQIDFLYALVKSAPGSSVEVEIIRDGNHQTINVALTDPPAQPQQARSEWASQLAYASSQAEYQVSQADYNISSAEYAKQSVQYYVDQVNGQLASTEKELASARDLEQKTSQELKVLGPNGAYAKKLWNGSLWTGTATSNGSILSWPTDDASSVYGFHAGQTLSVLPMGSDWCMVLLQNKTLGWVKREKLTIKGG